MIRLTKLQKRIISEIINNPKTNFNALWNKQGQSNLFAYHLKKLVDSDLLLKKDNFYELSVQGKVFANFFRDEDIVTTPIVGVQLLIKSSDRFIVEKRLKQPFKDFFGFISSKIIFGESMRDCAKRLFFDRFGLIIDSWEIRGCERIRTFEKENCIHDIVLYTLKPSAEPDISLTKNQKWVSLEKYSEENTIPAPWIKKVVSETNFNITGIRKIEEGRISCFEFD